MKNNPEIILRADGNHEIGLGHIYRCIALAEMLKDEFYVQLVTKTDTTLLPFKESGFDYTFIPDVIGFSEEANWFKKNYSSDTIIVLDGYNFKENYQQKIKDSGYKLVYIDDLVQGTQKADLVVNHNPGVKESDYRKENYTKFALGGDYAVLRPLFLEAAKQKTEITETNIAFICFGGSDIRDFTLLSTEVLLEVKKFDEINIVTGNAYQHKEIFKLQKLNNKINIYKNLSEKELIAVMRKSNFAVAPPSTILFELLAIGLPILSGYYVDNQKLFYEYLINKNLIFEIGNFNKITKLQLKEVVKKSINRKFTKNNFIDGNQKKRFIKHFKILQNGY